MQSMPVRSGSDRSLPSWTASTGRVTVKVDPSPGVLRTSIWPPISVTRRWQMANPSPVPPNRRVVDASACVNDENS